jgi:hypothetical protein
MPVGLDLEWEVSAVSAAAHEHSAPARGVHGYEQFGIVHGELLLERSRYELDAVGLRSHTWGAPSFEAPVQSSWLHGADLSASFTVTEPDRVDGCIATNGGDPEPITTVLGETQRGADGLPVAARFVVDDRLEVNADVLGLTVVPLTGSRGERATLARGLCRYEVSGVAGEATIANGWSSWLRPE